MAPTCDAVRIGNGDDELSLLTVLSGSQDGRLVARVDNISSNLAAKGWI